MRIVCFLFGHKWIAQEFRILGGDEGFKFHDDICLRCKKENGNIKFEHELH